MKQNFSFILILNLLFIYVGSNYGRCDAPTTYKSYYYYTVFLTKPEKAPDDFYLVLTGNEHGLYGGESHKKTDCKPIVRFELYSDSQNKPTIKRVFVTYYDFMDAINSDQPAHNVRVKAGDQYIRLSKIFVREFRNGFAGRALNKIVAAGTH